MQDKAIALVVFTAIFEAFLAEFHSDLLWPFVIALIAGAVFEVLRRSDEP